MRLTINVNQTDIALGERADCSSCPIALAILREHSDKISLVSVRERIYLNTKDNKIFVSKGMPKTMAYWVAYYDEFGPQAVKPFTSEEIEFMEVTS